MSDGSIFSVRETAKDVLGAIGGSVACCYTGQPFDTVKVRMQKNPALYNSPLATAAAIAAKEGVPALWKGAVPTALGMIAENAMAFGVNEQLKRLFPERADGGMLDRILRPFAMGALTGCCSALVLCPSEVVKTLTQMQGEGKKGGMTSDEVTKRVWTRRGATGFFAGLEAQIMRDGPFYASFFGSYDLFCYLMATYLPMIPEELRYFTAGGLAGMAGWAFVMPADVPKTLVQQNWEARVAGDFWPTFGVVLKERGISGLYNGIGPALLRAFPANAALFLTVELIRKLFDRVLPPPKR